MCVFVVVHLRLSSDLGVCGDELLAIPDGLELLGNGKLRLEENKQTNKQTNDKLTGNMLQVCAERDSFDNYQSLLEFDVPFSYFFYITSLIL